VGSCPLAAPLFPISHFRFPIPENALPRHSVTLTLGLALSPTRIGRGKDSPPTTLRNRRRGEAEPSPFMPSIACRLFSVSPFLPFPASSGAPIRRFAVRGRGGEQPHISQTSSSAPRTTPNRSVAEPGNRRETLTDRFWSRRFPPSPFLRFRVGWGCGLVCFVVKACGLLGSVQSVASLRQRPSVS
jgi:hypothetical protein